MSERIYISGPITGREESERRDTFQKWEDYLWRNGYEAFNPMKNGMPFDAPSSDHMRMDLLHLLDSDGILLLEGWQYSDGCNVELAVAKALRLPVYHQFGNDMVMFNEMVEQWEECKPCG